MNLLFICSRNKWRSRTAETIFKDNGQHAIKSAGTAKSARIRVQQSMLDWADKIWVMEQKHKDRLAQDWDTTAYKDKIIVLDIPDEYTYMDEELIEILEHSLSEYL